MHVARNAFPFDPSLDDARRLGADWWIKVTEDDADLPQAHAADVLVMVPAAPGRIDHGAGPASTEVADAPPGASAGGAVAEVAFEETVALTDIPVDGVGVPLGDTFLLHSNPTSNYKIYLDFDGHTTSGNLWNAVLGGPSFYSPAFSLDDSEAFNATELALIQQIWQRIAEYFSPFNIDVTTEDPGEDALTRSGNGDKTFGIRVVLTDEAGRAAGGTSWIGSFDWSTTEAAFVYTSHFGDNAKSIADAAAHEVGHTLGLSHDGQTTASGTSSYYHGHGSGVTDWAPVMGTGYDANIVQWSSGEYYGANELQDDLTIITTQNSGVAYVADDYGDTFRRAASLTGSIAGYVTSVQTFGVISGSGSQNDIDMFRFDVAQGGSVDLTISSWTRVYVAGTATPSYVQSPFTMLDLSATLYDAGGHVVTSSNDPERLDASIHASGLAGGTYYLALDGVGWGDPYASTPTGYTEYGSLGQYMIEGTFTSSAPPPATLKLSTNAVVTTEDGEVATFRIYLDGVNELTPDTVAVQITGHDGTEGALSESTYVLTRENGWTTDVALVGLNDREDDGDVAYALNVSAGGFGSASLSVVNLDNDALPATTGARFGTYAKAPSAWNAKLAALAADDGKAMTLTEGTSGGSATIEWRWHFDNQTPGTKVVHLDAASPDEAVRFEYSNDGMAWTSLDPNGTADTLWAGDYEIASEAPTLWIRLVDAGAANDSARSTISIDLLTIENASSASIDNWLV